MWEWFLLGALVEPIVLILWKNGLCPLTSLPTHTISESQFLSS